MPRFALPACIVLLLLLTSGFAALLTTYVGAHSGSQGETSESDEGGRTPLGVHTDPLDDGLRIKLGMSEWFEPVQVIVQFESGLAGESEKSLLVKHGLLPKRLRRSCRHGWRRASLRTSTHWPVSLQLAG